MRSARKVVTVSSHPHWRIEPALNTWDKVFRLVIGPVLLLFCVIVWVRLFL